jgi:hypothetical protein
MYVGNKTQTYRSTKNKKTNTKYKEKQKNTKYIDKIKKLIIQ